MLTKTEQKLLDTIKQYGYCSVSTLRGRGPAGGKMNYGTRDRDAMFKLEAAGIIKITSRIPWEETRRGNKQSGTSFSFTLV